jgi:hypothetical protein
MRDREVILNSYLNESLSDLQVKDYWKLNEKQKELVTNQIIKNWESSHENHKRAIHSYLFLLEERILDAEEIELYEEMEILNRVKIKLQQKYIY